MVHVGCYGLFVNMLGSASPAMDLSDLIRHVERSWSAGVRRGTLLPRGYDLGIGLEERTARDRYSWDGMLRGSTPYAVIQYTLTGWGAFADTAGHVKRVPPGSFFVSVITTPHRYYLPAESPAWRFFYLILHHPFTVERLRANLAMGSAVQAASGDHPFTTSLLRLWTGIRRGDQVDDLTIERNLIDIALEHDRMLRERRAGLGEAEQMLADVRAQIAANPDSPLEVTELAKGAGMSRSAYAHRFAKLTGLAPARYVLQMRLEDVRRGLLEGDETLAALAQRTGFADANHLCKAFRRHYHQSPGQYRQQMGG